MDDGNQYRVDLGAIHDIDRVSVNWASAYAVAYQVQVSDDGNTWTTVASVTGNASDGTRDHAGLTARGRYVRVYCTQTNTTGNYSLYDFNVYGR